MGVHDKIQTISGEAVGKASVVIGSSGWFIDTFTVWEAWIDIFLKCGNAALLIGGLYLMFHKVIDKWRKSG